MFLQEMAQGFVAEANERLSWMGNWILKVIYEKKLNLIGYVLTVKKNLKKIRGRNGNAYLLWLIFLN